MKKIILSVTILFSFCSYAQDDIHVGVGMDMINLKSEVINSNLSGVHLSVTLEHFYTENLSFGGSASLNRASGGSFTARSYDTYSSTWQNPEEYSFNMIGGTFSGLLNYKVKLVTFHLGAGFETFNLKAESKFFFDDAHISYIYSDGLYPPYNSINGHFSGKIRTTPYLEGGAGLKLGDISCRASYRKTFFDKFKASGFEGRMGILSLNVSYKFLTL